MPITFSSIVAFNPEKRLTVEEALQQPYLEEYYDPADEPVTEAPFQYEVNRNFIISSLSFILIKFEIDDLPTNTLKELVFLEVVNFKKKH